MVKTLISRIYKGLLETKAKNHLRKGEREQRIYDIYMAHINTNSINNHFKNSLKTPTEREYMSEWIKKTKNQ